MNAIDTHVHLWDPDRVALPWMQAEHDPIARAFGPDDLAPLMSAAGVDRAILVQSASTYDDTELLLEFGRESDLIAALVVWLPLGSPERTAARLDELAGEPKVRGVRHQIHDEADPHWILREDVLQSLLLVEERGLVLELPVVWPRHLEDVQRLADAFPRLAIVIDHLGKPPLDGDLTGWARSLEQAAAHGNVVAKISGLNTATAREDWNAATFSPAVETALAVFGRERLLCGSDWPYALLNGDYARIWRETRSLVGGDSMVLAANAVRLYGLAETPDGTH